MDKRQIVAAHTAQTRCRQVHRCRPIPTGRRNVPAPATTAFLAAGTSIRFVCILFPPPFRASFIPHHNPVGQSLHEHPCPTSDAFAFRKKAIGSER